MESIEKRSAICVLTARGIEKILGDGGSQAWVLDAKRARQCEYEVCDQNRGFTDDWGHVSAPHHTAFIVGRLKDVVRSKELDSENRWILTFSEYAEIDGGLGAVFLFGAVGVERQRCAAGKYKIPAHTQ